MPSDDYARFQRHLAAIDSPPAVKRKMLLDDLRLALDPLPLEALTALLHFLATIRTNPNQEERKDQTP